MTRAVFLDRDGVIIEDSGYVGEVERVNFLPGVGAAIRRLKENGFRVVVITNQAGVARGYYDEAAVQAINDHIQEKLAGEDASIDRFYYCPHHVDGVIEEYSKECGCRKPKTGMIDQAAGEFGIDLAASFVIGDRESDIEAGHRAGCRTIMLAGAGVKDAATAADYIAPDLPRAVDFLLSLEDKEAAGGKG